jgi:hypothetical protein
MNAPAEPANPFERKEDPLSPAPPLRCEHAEPCPERCHVDVGRFGERFEMFKKALGNLGTLQENGLFVAVGGPTSCGKTSLVNRCAWWARAHLGDAVRAQIIDLTHVGSNRPPEERLRKLVGRIVMRVNTDGQWLFDGEAPGYQPSLPFAAGGPPDLDDLMTDLTDQMADDRALIIIPPPADQAAMLDPYWAATCKKTLWLVESADSALGRRCATAWKADGGEARSCLLDMGGLNPGDPAAFAEARTSGPGSGRCFPALDGSALDAVTILSGDPPMVQIGSIQKLLYGVYDFYLHAGRGPDTIITGADVMSYVRRTAEGEG